MKEFTVTTWDNGKPNLQTGSGLGLKVAAADRDIYFSRKYQNVKINLDDQIGFVVVNIDKESFWADCSELISYEIGVWLIENNYATWNYQKPHKLKISYLGENIFHLRKQLNMEKR